MGERDGQAVKSQFVPDLPTAEPSGHIFASSVHACSSGEAEGLEFFLTQAEKKNVTKRRGRKICFLKEIIINTS